MISDSAQSHRRWYQFGPFVIDRRSRLLWRDGALVPLTGKAFEILGTLIDERQRIVDKNELLEIVWPKTAVEENTLTRHISTLRKALEEHPHQHQYILTIPGHGYQFVADVVELPGRPDHLCDNVSAHKPHANVDSIPVARMATGPAAQAARPLRRTLASPIVAITTVVAIVSAIGVLLALKSTHVDGPLPSHVLRQVTFQAGLQREPAFSPDGRFVAYTSSASGSSDIWIQALDEPMPTSVVSSSAEDSQPDWSPDGATLVFRSERDGGGLFVVPVQGGHERQLSSFGYHPRWSPDGGLILFSSSGHSGGRPKFYLVSADGGAPRQLRPDLLEAVGSVHVNWKPGRRDVSLWGRGERGWTFVTFPVDAGMPIVSSIAPDVQRRIDAAGLTLGRFTWARSGRYLYFEGVSQGVRNLWRISVDPATLHWIGGPDRLTTGTGEDTDITVSPDGSRLVFSARSLQTRLWTFPFDAGNGRLTGAGEPLTSGAAGELDAEALRDGSKLVYSAVRGGRQELWERSLAERRERLVLKSRMWLSRPHWSPDGTRIAYTRRPQSESGDLADAVVAVLSVKDGSEHLFTKPGESRFVPSDWSADGTQLIGGCPQGRGHPVATCVLDVPDMPSRPPRMRTIASHPTQNLFEQRFSPDQRWISFMAVDRSDSARATVYVMPASGGEWRAITDGKAYDDKPHWSPDGHAIYFASDRGGLWNVWGRRLDPTNGSPVGDPFRVTSFDSPRRTLASQLSRMQFAIAAGRLFLPITDTAGELWMLEDVDK